MERLEHKENLWKVKKGPRVPFFQSVSFPMFPSKGEGNSHGSSAQGCLEGKKNLEVFKASIPNTGHLVVLRVSVVLFKKELVSMCEEGPCFQEACYITGRHRPL